MFKISGAVCVSSIGFYTNLLSFFSLFAEYPDAPLASSGNAKWDNRAAPARIQPVRAVLRGLSKDDWFGVALSPFVWAPLDSADEPALIAEAAQTETTWSF